ncbi:DNA ligase [Desulfoplanes formicivorans]|uniref:DNA ligase n=1 Tax=Desulfoplanes formicivorans TaxID=1592317 RepID=A0A194AJ34_9BACT|nr:DNA ligase [Desulfoplanes formicivorans]GAU08754.1 DNA ligase [Desulfoplanes formicivorans]
MKYDHHVLRIFLSVITLGYLLTGFVPPCVARPQLQAPTTYRGNEDITGWYMSEKLDGIRGYWDGHHLLTREGTVIHAPSWFTSNLPPFELDGELWAGRGNFEIVQSTVLDTTPSSGWQNITYNIFEVPHASGDFPARLAKAQNWFANHKADHVRIIPQTICTGHQHVQRFLKHIAQQGGEGVIIKDPTIPYQDGSEQHLVKLKHINYMDGVVMGHTPGKGSYAGLMGSLTLQLDNGVVFNLGTGFSMQERRHPPRKGAVVTFKHYGFSQSGKPRFASFVKVKTP